MQQQQNKWKGILESAFKFLSSNFFLFLLGTVEWVLALGNQTQKKTQLIDHEYKDKDIWRPPTKLTNMITQK